MPLARIVACSLVVTMAQTLAASQDRSSEVKEVLSSKQFGYAQKQAELFDIGKSDLDALVETLRNEPQYWNYILPVLGKLKDDRATVFILGYLDEGNAYIPALYALKKIGDPRAIEPVREIFQSEGVFLHKRLLAAEVLVSLGAEDDRRVVEEFILNDTLMNKLRETENASSPQPNYGYEQRWDVLAELGTDASLAKLAKDCTGGLLDYDTEYVLELLQEYEIRNHSVFDALLKLIMWEEASGYIRVATAETAVNLAISEEAKERLESSLESLQKSLVTQGYNQELVSRVESLEVN